LPRARSSHRNQGRDGPRTPPRIGAQEHLEANTYYNAATGEILLLILERIERLHHKIDRIEKKLGSAGAPSAGNVW
jgi:hypothetical protein